MTPGMLDIMIGSGHVIPGSDAQAAVQNQMWSQGSRYHDCQEAHEENEMYWGLVPNRSRYEGVSSSCGKHTPEWGKQKSLT